MDLESRQNTVGATIFVLKLLTFGMKWAATIDYQIDKCVPDVQHFPTFFAPRYSSPLIAASIPYQGTLFQHM